MKEIFRELNATFQKRWSSKLVDFESERLNHVLKLIRPSDKVSFDLDGVLIDSAFPVVERANKILNTNFTVDDIYGWYFIRDEAIKIGYPEKMAEKLNFELWTDPFLLSIAKPIPGAIDFYRQVCKKSNHKIPLITVRNSGLTEVTENWVKKYLPEASDLIYMRKHDDDEGNEFKIRTLKELEINFHFDDSSDIIGLIVKRLKKTKPIFISYVPLDVEKPLDKRVFVVPSWEWSPERYS